MRRSPGSACLVFHLGKRHFKLAVTAAGRRGLLREARGEARAACDDFWSPYVHPARYCNGLVRHAARRDAAKNMVLSKLVSAVRRRIDSLPPTPDGWPARFPRIASIAGRDSDWPERMLAIFRDEVCASVHGDLCIANCLDQGGDPLLVDWGNFRADFWALYDLYHPEIVRQADETGDPWLRCLQRQVGAKEWDAKRTVRYLLCRVELEADQDIAMGRLDERRRRKYADALHWAETLLTS